MSDEIVRFNDQKHITRNRFHTLCGKEIPYGEPIVFSNVPQGFLKPTNCVQIRLCGLCVETLKEENQFLTQRVEDEESGTVFLEYEEA